MPSLTRDTPRLAQDYETQGERQYEHGQLLLQSLALRPGERLLDLGCGSGRLAALAARHHVSPGGSVLGVDPLALRLQLAHTRSGPGLHFAPGRGEDLSFLGAESFDAVLMNSVYHWLARPAPVLAEVARVLRPGGRLALNVASLERPHDSRLLLSGVLASAGLARGGSPHGARRATHAEVAQQLESAGFVVEESRLRRFVDRFDDEDAVLDFLEASAFGNFLGDYLPGVREALAAQLREALRARATEKGIVLQRHLHFVLARKPEANG